MLINTLRYSCVRVRAQRRKIGEELEGAPLLTAGHFQVRSSNGKSSAGLPPHPPCNEGRCLASLGYAQQKAVLMGHTNDYFVPLLAAFSILLFSFQAVSGQWSQWVQPASWEKGFYIQLCVWLSAGETTSSPALAGLPAKYPQFFTHCFEIPPTSQPLGCGCRTHELSQILMMEKQGRD